MTITKYYCDFCEKEIDKNNNYISHTFNNISFDEKMLFVTIIVNTSLTDCVIHLCKNCFQQIISKSIKSF